MKRLLILLIFAAPVVCSANSLPLLSNLPLLPAQVDRSSHKFFISTQNASSESFDTWKIDSGYSYSLFADVDLYVGTRINSASLKYESGFLSGVSYQFSEKVSFNSSLHTYKDEEEDSENSVAAEISSRVQLTDNLDLHATLDYEEWQQGVEVGLGFRF
ncbi:MULTISPECIES: ribonuclease activity regulator protein RraA [Vibrio]|uniref:Ribonuclease regulator n=1 Tax=Vibrio kanaloae TaxID=170673 RepID=A0ABV4LG57_9VIBR|nr:MULTISPECIES: ribonuclease activity regulator protein RraA [Vibrio]NOI99024.1 ribonuclease regulator [Vibrio kanaloae]OEF12138.1 ribonuclease regulator [Vibrio kanaloae 5S-149]